MHCYLWFSRQLDEAPLATILEEQGEAEMRLSRQVRRNHHPMASIDACIITPQIVREAQHRYDIAIAFVLLFLRLGSDHEIRYFFPSKVICLLLCNLML